MAKTGKNAKKIGMAVAVVGVSVGTYMAVDSLTNNNADAEQISQTVESQIKSQNFLFNEKKGLDDLKEIKVKTDDEDVAFNVINVELDDQKDKFDELIKRALHKENQNNITLEELIVAYEEVKFEEFKNIKEFDFVNVKILQPKINKDGQLAFNEEQMIQGNDISIASIESLVELYDEGQELSDDQQITIIENVIEDGIQSTSKETKVAAVSEPASSLNVLEVVDLNLLNTKPEPKQPEVVAPKTETPQTALDVAAQAETTSPTESDKTETEVTPQLEEPKKAEAEVTPQPEEPKKAETEVTPQPEEPKKAETEVTPQPEEPKKAETEVTPQPEEPKKAEIEVTPQLEEPKKAETEVTPQPKQPEVEVKVEVKVEVTPQPELKQEVEVKPQPELKQEVEVAPQPELKQEVEVAPQPELKQEVEVAPQPELKQEVEVAPQPELKQEVEVAPQPELKQEVEVAPQPEPKQEVEVAPQPEPKPTELDLDTL